jgi:hypothetical protein
MPFTSVRWTSPEQQAASSACPTHQGYVVVKKAKTELLIVDDYGPADASAAFYQSIVDTLFGGRFQARTFSTSRPAPIRRRVGSTCRRTQTRLSSRRSSCSSYVLWYTDNDPTIDVAQVASAGIPAKRRIHFLHSGLPRERGRSARRHHRLRSGRQSRVPSPFLCSRRNESGGRQRESPGYPTLVRDTQGVPVAFIRDLCRRKINARKISTASRRARAGRDNPLWPCAAETAASYSSEFPCTVSTAPTMSESSSI